MLWWLVQNTLTIGLLAVVVSLVCRVGRFRPAVEHTLWLVVLIKFLTPSFICWPWSVEELCDRFAPPADSATHSNSADPIAAHEPRLAINSASSLVDDLTSTSRGSPTVTELAAP